MLRPISISANKLSCSCVDGQWSVPYCHSPCIAVSEKSEKQSKLLIVNIVDDISEVNWQQYSEIQLILINGYNLPPKFRDL